MENLFVKLQKLSSTVFGVNFFNDFPKSKTNVVKSIIYIFYLIILLLLSLHDAFFNLNIKLQEKLLIYCFILGLSSFIMLFISVWCNENQCKLLTKWVQTRYAPRSFHLINGISNVAYGTLSIRMWKISK